MTFCWLPPLSVLTRWRNRAVSKLTIPASEEASRCSSRGLSRFLGVTRSRPGAVKFSNTRRLAKKPSNLRSPEQ